MILFEQFKKKFLWDKNKTNRQQMFLHMNF